jgi:hypothetical protein
MTRNFRSGWAAALLVAVLALPAAAADSPLAQVPADAALVVHVRGFERIKDRLLTLVKNALPDLAQKAEDKVAEIIKTASMGRELKGIPRDGSILVVLTEASLNPEEVAAVIVQVSDYQQFRDGLLKEDERKALKKDPAGYETTEIEGKTANFIHRDGYAILTVSKDSASRFTKTPAKGLADKLDAAVAKRLLESDVGVYVNLAVATKQLAEQIKQIREQVEKSLEQGDAADESNREVNKRLADSLFQLIEDGQTVFAWCDFRPEGVAGHVEITVPANSKTNNVLKPARSSALTDRLGKLPAGELGYVAGQMDLPAFKDLLAKVQGAMANGSTSEGRAFKEALRALTDAQPWQLLGSFNLAPMQGLTVTDYKFPDKAVEAQLEMYRNFKGGTQGSQVQGEPKVRANAEKHRGFKLHSVSMAWDFDKMVNPKSGELPEAMKARMTEAFRKLMGEGMNVWFGSDGKSFVQITARDWDSARKLLDNYLDGKDTVAGTASFKEARKNLPAEATAVLVFDMARYVEFIVQLTRAMLPKDANAPEVKVAAGKYSYFGLSATLQPQRCQVDVWLAGSSLKDFQEMLTPLLSRPAP